VLANNIYVHRVLNFAYSQPFNVFQLFFTPHYTEDAIPIEWVTERYSDLGDEHCPQENIQLWSMLMHPSLANLSNTSCSMHTHAKIKRHHMTFIRRCDWSHAKVKQKGDHLCPRITPLVVSPLANAKRQNHLYCPLFRYLPRYILTFAPIKSIFPLHLLNRKKIESPTAISKHCLTYYHFHYLHERQEDLNNLNQFNFLKELIWTLHLSLDYIFYSSSNFTTLHNISLLILSPILCKAATLF
jgi:hypothetical protein